MTRRMLVLMNVTPGQKAVVKHNKNVYVRFEEKKAKMIAIVKLVELVEELSFEKATRDTLETRELTHCPHH
jgi:hypothetical protein